MQFKDTGLGFGIVTIIMHWLGAALMIGFIVLCVSLLLIDDAALAGRIETCASVGAVCFVLFTFRISWRMRYYHPLPLGGAPPIEVIVGRGVSYGLLLAGVILPLIFWAMACAKGIDVVVFGYLLPVIWAPDADAAFYLSVLFWLGIAAFCTGFGLHLFGAFKHQFVLKDDAVLRLMGKNVEL